MALDREHDGPGGLEAALPRLAVDQRRVARSGTDDAIAPRLGPGGSGRRVAGMQRVPDAQEVGRVEEPPRSTRTRSTDSRRP